VPKLVLGGNNNFQGTFLSMLFFWPKTPALDVSPAQHDYRFLPGQGSGVRRGAARE
jgi:hypothetical protein